MTPVEIPMTSARRLACLCLTCLGTVALSASVPSPEGDRMARLRALPVEERLRLAANLRVFDALPRAEQEAIRGLDRAVTSEPPENQANYNAALRRYHLWLRTLTESQRTELESLPPENRLSLVTKLVAEQRKARRPDPLLYQVADFGGISPYDLAWLVKVWLKLTPQEKATFANIPDPEKRRTHLMDYNRFYHAEPIRRPSREQIEAAYERTAKSRPRPFLKKLEEKQQEKIKLRLGEYAYLAEHPPTKVAADKLLEFDRAFPGWLRSGIVDVPPEEARWLLTHLYRLIFPYPQEIGVTKPAPSATTKTTPPRSEAPKARGTPKAGAAPGPY